MATMQAHWDIFCRVIDNYGDIGVCWRLARQLRVEHGLKVRLWLDDLAPLALLRPGLDPCLPTQEVDAVDVRRWQVPFPTVEPADVVIEAFACEVPKNYLEAMASSEKKACWINLEYLSAENWVEGCHGLASPHPTLPLTKYFFFPGFTSGTGGLLLEKGLLEARDACQAGLLNSAPLEVSLFCYEEAPVAALVDTWAAGKLPIRCHVPPGKPLENIKRHLGGKGPWQLGSLQIEPMPFLPQPEFDRFLWKCSINFVRGEDSFVRAQWAARPFVWQAYPQDDGAHRDKLEAFLDRYLDGVQEPAASAARAMARAWNGDGGDLPASWSAFAAQQNILAAHGRRWAEKLASQGNLAANLVKFCADRL